MSKYRVLKKNIFKKGPFSILPIRLIDRFKIMQWRNEQIYHLRQLKPLSEEDQDIYFNNIVSGLFEMEQPSQILFSYIYDEECIGYGGLVHINWYDKHAEISFVLNTALEKTAFSKHWQTYLSLIEQVAFDELKLNKIFTYAYDLRPHLYTTIEAVGYKFEARLKEHCLFEGEYNDVVIHSKHSSHHKRLLPAQKKDAELLFKWANDPAVRNNAINTEPVLWENHLEWYQNKLKSPLSKMFILYQGATPVGQIRIDFNDTEWEIDYSVDKEFRGKGIGKQLIQLIISETPSSHQLKAVVRNENKASLKVFEQLNFQNLPSEEENITKFMKQID